MILMLVAAEEPAGHPYDRRRGTITVDSHAVTADLRNKHADVIAVAAMGCGISVSIPHRTLAAEHCAGIEFHNIEANRGSAIATIL